MTRYFGVIGNRDYIKLCGERRPFWEFLDQAPDGWLCSLVYKRDDVPSGQPRIWDCGAWSYRRDDIPRLGQFDVTAQWAASMYAMIAGTGDFCVAPDHMLIPGPGVDLDARRRFNEVAAFEFIECVDMMPRGVVPMGVVHGIDCDERLRRARELYALGYRALAIGGVAGRASSHRQHILAMVEAVRQAVPDVWLHVLGISAPSFVCEWRRLGVDSFDGASHFKQAFLSGTFYVERDGDLDRFRAARPGEPVTAPECGCLACRILAEAGVDTRRYGSNESNMGRAAHNLNQYIRAIRVIRR